MFCIGDLVLDFIVIIIVGNLKFLEYNVGSWVVLFFYFVDFMLVCIMEMLFFVINYDWFKECNIKFLGLSIDSVYVYLVWVNNVCKNMDVYMDFFIIVDFDMKVLQFYGMLYFGQSSIVVVCVVFIVDLEGIV